MTAAATTTTDAPRRQARSHIERIALYIMGGLFGALLLVIVILLLTLNWNTLRGPIGRFASAQTHRSIRLDGDLKVHLLTWTPTVSIGGLKIGNPAWAGPGDTATADDVIVSIKLLPLLHGQTILPLVQIDRPNLKLLSTKDGRHNWDFGPKKANAKPFKLPPIQRFIVNQGHLDYRDLKKGTTIVGTIDSNEKATGSGAHAFALVGHGTLNKSNFQMKVTGGPLINIRPNLPYPFTGDVTAGATHITARGHLAKPFDLNSYVTDLHLTGKDLADLYYLIGLTLPNTPAYDIKGELTHKGREYDFMKAAGRIGSSDLEGGLKVVLSAKNRPNLTANLSSRLLDFRDLATLLGAPPVGKAAAGATPAQKQQAAALAADKRLLPDTPLDVQRLRGMDATLHYKADAIQASGLPIRQAVLELTLDHGVLTLHPVSFSFPQGKLWANVSLDGRNKTPVTSADVRLNNIAIQNFIPHAKGTDAPLEGSLSARAKLTGAGDSVHNAAAASNGAVTVVMPGGKIRQAFAELLGVNAGKGLSLLLSKSAHETPIRCAVANFNVRNGVLQADQVVFDTGVVKVHGSGDIRLSNESVNLTLKGDTKQFRLTHVFLPITIGGHLRAPTFGVNPTPALAQAGVAAALGVVLTPLAAILPFVDPGLAKNADCAGLMSAAQSTAAPINQAAPAHATPLKGAAKR